MKALSAFSSVSAELTHQGLFGQKLNIDEIYELTVNAKSVVEIPVRWVPVDTPCYVNAGEKTIKERLDEAMQDLPVY